jgi:hypothetical protein
VHHYRSLGMHIRSDVELALDPVAAGEADLTIRARGAPPLSTGELDPAAENVIAAQMYQGTTRPWYVLEQHPEHVRLRLRFGGEFILRPTVGEIEWRAEPSHMAHVAPILLTGTVIAAYLTLQGHHVLHASAVRWEGKVLAFIGLSGQGKSTSAALCCAAGATPLADDLLVVQADPDGAMVRGGATALRMREKSRELVDLIGAGMRQGQTLDRRIELAPSPFEQGWAKLDAVIVPRPRRDLDVIDIQQLSPAKATVELLRHTRLDGLRRPAEVQRTFAQASQLAQLVPVSNMHVPWGPPWNLDIGRRILERALGEDL